MKKTLIVKRDTVRNLNVGELRSVNGGDSITSHNIPYNCYDSNIPFDCLPKTVSALCQPK